MKKLLSKKAVNTILGLAIAVLAVLIVWNVFDVGTRMQLNGAVDDILAARNVGKARETLRELAKETGRAGVITALKEAVNEDTDSVQGKIELIQTLSGLKEPRAARRALESKSKSARRAAAWSFHGDKTAEDVIRGIVIEWIRDAGADKRGHAAMIVNKLKIKECVPTLLEAIKTAPETNEQLQFQTHALDALAAFKPEGFVTRVLEIAEDKQQNSRMRGKAFNVLIRLDSAPVARLQALLLGIAKDPKGDNVLRNMAISTLRRKKFNNADAWNVLEEVLLRDSENAIIQRGCLAALGAHAPLDRVKNLILDRRVYNHDYFGIRVDVATALATLHVQEKIALEILVGYMVDDDPKDLDLLVAQEGFLSFWALTGMAYGVAEQRLFQRLPKKIPDEQAIRDYLWSAAHMRPGVSFPMVQAVRRLTTANLDEVNKSLQKGTARKKKIRRTEDLKRVAQTCRGNINQLLASIEKRKETAEKAKEDADKSKDQGPQLPKDDEKKKPAGKDD